MSDFFATLADIGFLKVIMFLACGALLIFSFVGKGKGKGGKGRKATKTTGNNT